MSILIKGMEMPTNCMDCPFKGFDRAGGRGNICTINDSITLHAVLDGVNIKFVRMGDCPLVPVPPHGDLIDRDALMAEFEKAENAMERHGREFSFSFISSGQEISTEWFAVETMVEDAPTIIPAEEDE